MNLVSLFRIYFASIWIGGGFFDIDIYLIRVESSGFQFEIERTEARWKFAVRSGRDDDV